MSATIGFVIPGSHPALAGHFPDLPVVPGSLILEHIIDAWGGRCGTVAFAKFHAPLGPDQPVEVRFEPAPGEAGAHGGVAFSCRRGTELICSGRLQGVGAR